MAKVGISEKTFQTWKCALDPNNRWIKAEIIERIAVRVWCHPHYRVPCYATADEAGLPT